MKLNSIRSFIIDWYANLSTFEVVRLRVELRIMLSVLQIAVASLMLSLQCISCGLDRQSFASLRDVCMFDCY